RLERRVGLLLWFSEGRGGQALCVDVGAVRQAELTPIGCIDTPKEDAPGGRLPVTLTKQGHRRRSGVPEKKQSVIPDPSQH
ncbi:MAG: hypothetical protein IJF59_01610, partial [Clostridia bacterium]|nr:hypothetical protein [Clostridia bacterium]